MKGLFSRTSYAYAGMYMAGEKIIFVPGNTVSDVVNKRKIGNCQMFIVYFYFGLFIPVILKYIVVSFNQENFHL